MSADETRDDAAAMASRRDEIAEAGIVLVAREGIRALTQRRVDVELGLAPGTTSYYARTERQLVQLVVRRLAGRTLADVGAAPPPAREGVAPPVPPAHTVDGVTARLLGSLGAIALRRDDVLARLALTVHLVDDPELHAFVTHASPVRAEVVRSADQLLRGVGVADAAAHAPDLVGLLNGILWDWLAGPGVEEAHRIRAEVVVGAYLRGIGATDR